MRRAAKVDSNHSDVVEAFRKMGASVFSTHMVGAGFPDLVVGYRGRNYLVEVKDGEKRPSARALTEDEQKFFDTWKGQVMIVESVTEIAECLNT